MRVLEHWDFLFLKDYYHWQVTDNSSDSNRNSIGKRSNDHASDTNHDTDIKANITVNRELESQSMLSVFNVSLDMRVKAKPSNRARE